MTDAVDARQAPCLPGDAADRRGRDSTVAREGVRPTLRSAGSAPILTSPLSLTPGTRLGVYEITALIGDGGMGEVYRATDTKLKRQVAIKILPPSLAADARSARAVSTRSRSPRRR